MHLHIVSQMFKLAYFRRPATGSRYKKRVIASLCCHWGFPTHPTERSETGLVPTKALQKTWHCKLHMLEMTYRLAVGTSTLSWIHVVPSSFHIHHDVLIVERYQGSDGWYDSYARWLERSEKVSRNKIMRQQDFVDVATRLPLFT